MGRLRRVELLSFYNGAVGSRYDLASKPRADKLSDVPTVFVDAENVRRSLWPNMPKDELEDRSAAWGDAHGHDVVVVWEGKESADDRIAREVTEREAPVWVITSDRGLRERVRDHAERIIGGGSFARELRGQRE